MSTSQGHTCSRCGQVFPRSENLRRHLSRKNPCIDNTNLRNIPISSLTECNDLSYDPLPPTIGTYTEPICPFCGKTFSSITNRNKHTRYVCRSFLDTKMNTVIRKSMIEHLNHIEYKINSPECKTKEDALNIIKQEIQRITFAIESKIGNTQ